MSICSSVCLHDVYLSVGLSGCSLVWFALVVCPFNFVMLLAAWLFGCVAGGATDDIAVALRNWSRYGTIHLLCIHLWKAKKKTRSPTALLSTKMLVIAIACLASNFTPKIYVR